MSGQQLTRDAKQSLDGTRRQRRGIVTWKRRLNYFRRNLASPHHPRTCRHPGSPIIHHEYDV